MILTLLACGVSSTTGTITDGLTGEPMGGFDPADTAQSSMNCQTVVGPVAADGSFSLALCSGTTYTVEPKGDIFLPELHSIPDGGIAEPMKITGYRAPTGNGIYLVDGPKLKLLKTNTSLASDVLPDGTKVVYPAMALKDVPTVPAGGRLLRVGEEAERPLVPLVTHAERIPMAEGALPPCDLAGVRVTEGVAAPVTAEPEASKVLDVSARGRHLQYLEIGALPAGRYAAYDPKDSRAIILAFP